MVQRTLWILKFRGLSITFANALAIAQTQTDIYPPRLAAMVVQTYRESW